MDESISEIKLENFNRNSKIVLCDENYRPFIIKSFPLFSTHSVPLASSHLWDCSNVVFMTTFELSKKVVFIIGIRTLS